MHFLTSHVVILSFLVVGCGARDFRLLRITKSDVTRVTELAGPGSPGSYWELGTLSQDATRIFFARSPASDGRVCAVSKDGGGLACTEPFPGGVSSLVWNGALYFPTSPERIQRMGSVTTGSTAIAGKANVRNPWVDDASVWWLTFVGDLYRVDK